jgi:DNA-binding transcriptional ArsR family regulator
LQDKRELYAVITGDLVGSSEISYNDREILLSALHDSFSYMNAFIHPDYNHVPFFEISRGDSFQTLFSDPENALMASVLILLKLSLFSEDEKEIETRISIGVGSVEFLSESGSVGEADGQAFRFSGKTLDSMKENERKLMITTANPALNLILESQCSFFDYVANRWTRIQKKFLLDKLIGMTQGEIAKKYGKSQSTVSQSLKAAGYDSLKLFLDNYANLFEYSEAFSMSDQ